MKINNHLKKIDLIYWSILIFSLFPLIPNRIKGLPVIILFLFSITKVRKKQFQWMFFFINSSLYFVYLVSYFIFYKIDGESKQVLETSLSILVIPIIFSLLIPEFKFDKKLLSKFLKGFVFSSTFYAVIVIFFIVLDTETYYYSDWYTNKARKLIEEFPYIGQHPIYASVFSAISVFFLFNLINIKNNKILYIENIYYFICFVINSLFLILLSSRGVLISLLFSFLLFTFFKIKKIKYRLSIILLFSIIMLSLFQYNRRMKELINFDTYIKLDSNYSNSYRFQTYKCGYKLLKENFITGYGVGNVQLKLNDCYNENGLKSMRDKYNTHNQYLDIILKTGIVGFSLFLFFLIYNFLIAINSKNTLFIIISIFYCIVFLTENILLRQSGVILFYFLILFLNKFNFITEDNKND